MCVCVHVSWYEGSARACVRVCGRACLRAGGREFALLSTSLPGCMPADVLGGRPAPEYPAWCVACTWCAMK